MRSIESLKLKNEQVFFRKLYYDIMKLSPEIRFVTIIDFDGRLMFGGQREGISNYLNPKSEKESLRHTIDAWLIREKLSNVIGSGKYTLTEYAKIKRITIPTDKNHLIYLTTEITVDHDKLITKILKLLQYY